MSLSKPDFEKIFASQGSVLPVSDPNYLLGFEYLGSNPPTKQEFNDLLRRLDLKTQWLNTVTSWTPTRVVAQGDICHPSKVGSPIIAICTVGGTTGATEPVWTAPGTTITDGGATWEIRLVTDAKTVGGKTVTEILGLAGNTTWRAGQSVTAGVHICTPTLWGSYKRMECVQSGVTGPSEPVWSDIGTLIADGTAKWIVDDSRDGTLPGEIVQGLTLRPGYVKANGGLLTRASYPRLYKWAADNNLLVAEADWAATKPGMFAVGDGATTFRIPDLRGEFLRSFDDGRGVDAGRVLGSKQADELKAHKHGLQMGATDSDQGTFGGGRPGIYGVQYTLETGGPETRPRNIAIIAAIKY